MDSSNKKPKLSKPNKEGKEEDDDDALDKSMSSSSSDVESSPSLEMMARAIYLNLCGMAQVIGKYWFAIRIIIYRNIQSPVAKLNC